MPSGDVPNPTSLYPQPPAAPTNALAQAVTPLQAIQTVNAFTQLQSNQQSLAARQATGEAYAGALNDDGSVDQAKLAAALRANPAAAYSLPETTDRMLSQTTAQTALDQKRTAFEIDGLGALADDPKLNLDKARSTMVTLARNLRIPGWQVNNVLDALPSNPKELRGALVQMRNLAIGSAGASTPTDVGVTDEGVTQNAPRGAYNYRTSGGAVPTNLAPGEAGLMGSSSERAAALQATASTSPQYRADLANLRQMSKVLDIGGPTVKYEKAFGQLAQRFGLPSTLSPDQLTSAEEFDKTANTIALRQGASLGGTDASRALSVGATPNTGMSKFGREGVISMLEGNQDFIDRAREQWLEARANGTPASKHDEFMHSFGKNFDVRVFQFNKLDRAGKQKFLDTLDRTQIPEFEQSYKNAAAHGWVNPLTKDTK